MDHREFSSFLNSISSYPLPVLDTSISLDQYYPLDLSIHNEALQNVNVSDSSVFEVYINSLLAISHKKVAYGGYNEIRNIYRRSTYFNQDNMETERNIHLGIDLWLVAGSPIFAPLDGIVHSFAYNKNFGDYGPTIILKHQVDNVIFYTLYGHLSLSSIDHLKMGAVFEQGNLLATLGDASVNGDYPPHLHFQIIWDLGDWIGDYPGVCSKADLPFYLANCPDPNVILKLY